MNSHPLLMEATMATAEQAVERFDVFGWDCGIKTDPDPGGT